MSLRIRRGTEANRTGQVFDSGELVVTTDQFRLFVGDGATPGGRNIATYLAGSQLVFNETTGKLDLSLNITADDVPNGINNQYFSNELAQDAVASALTLGVHSGINFIYTATQDGANRIDATVSLNLDSLSDVIISGTPTNGQVLKYNTSQNAWVPGTDTGGSGSGSGITAVQDDVAPTLGGNLDLNTHNITGAGNVSITGTIAATVGLGSDLSLNSHNITGTGNIDTIGDIHVTGTLLPGTGLGGNLLLNSFNIHDDSISNITIGGLLSAGPATFKNTDITKSPLRITNIYSEVAGESITIAKARGTSLVPTTVLTNDILVAIAGYGYDGTTYCNSAAIKMKASGNISSGAVPGILEFHTAGNDGILVRRGFINERGQFILNSAMTSNTTEIHPVVFNIRQIHNNATTGQAQLNRARGTLTSLLAVQGQDELGNLAFIGHDGSAERWGANISAVVDATVGVNITTNQIPTKLVLSVNPGSTGATPEAAVVINSNKVVDFKGTALAAGSVNVAGGVVEYLHIKVNGVDRAIPLYAVL